MDTKKLYDLIRMDSPEAVLNEAIILLRDMFPDFDTDSVTAVFNTTVRLYNGRYPGYRACTTKYHDLQHITETFLAMLRLMHGAFVEGEPFSRRSTFLGLVAALLHDSGYIQEKNDRKGTGGKHTIIHVRRSMDFLERYGRENGLSGEEIQACQTMIYCTDLTADFNSIVYPSREIELLGKLLATADLIAQMADRTHLEKLLYLYQEFREGMVSGYESAEDLLRKTMGFYDLVDDRFKNKLNGVERFMKAHFASRWNINRDLYRVSIENAKQYLSAILKKEDSELFEHLRRKGIVHELNAGNSRKGH